MLQESYCPSVLPRLVALFRGRDSSRRLPGARSLPRDGRVKGSVSWRVQYLQYDGEVSTAVDLTEQINLSWFVASRVKSGVSCKGSCDGFLERNRCHGFSRIKSHVNSNSWRRISRDYYPNFCECCVQGIHRIQPRDNPERRRRPRKSIKHQRSNLAVNITSYL